MCACVSEYVVCVHVSMLCVNVCYVCVVCVCACVCECANTALNQRDNIKCYKTRILPYADEFLQVTFVRWLEAHHMEAPAAHTMGGRMHAL